MVTMENYQFVFRLRDLAAIKICKYLWRLPSAMQFIKLSLKEKHFSPNTEVTVYIEGSELTDEINKLALPEELNHELTIAFKSMACKIFHWFRVQKPKYFNKLASQLLSDYISWTDDGLIDTSKTLTGLYNSNKLVNNYITWLMVCHNFLEDCIRDLWPKLDKNTLKKIKKIPADKTWFSEIPIFYWLHRMSDDENEKAILFKVLRNHGTLYNKEVSIEENMFIFSVLGHNYEALKYFWKFYDDNQKMRIITRLPMIPLCFRNISIGSNLAPEGASEDATQIIMFLVRQFLNYEMDDALITLLHETNILRKFTYWLWQELFMRIIEEPERYHGKINYVVVLMVLMGSLEKNNPTRNEVKFRMIFHQIWKKNPDDFKKLINYKELVDDYVERKDIPILKLIMNDEYFSEQREAHLDYVLSAVSADSIYDKDFLHKFIEEILVRKEEKDRLKLKIEDYKKIYYQLLTFSYQSN